MVFLRAFLKSAVITFLVYLAITSIGNYFYGDEFNFVSLLTQAGFFAVFFSLVMVSLQHSAVREIVAPNKPTDAEMKVNQVVTAMSDMSLAQLRSLIEGEGWQVRKDEADRITVKKGISGFSWGEIIIVQKTSNADEFIIRSRPWIGLTSIDFGTNLSNVRTIKKLIDESKA